jgi:hypothetical protein
MSVLLVMVSNVASAVTEARLKSAVKGVIRIGFFFQ